jgi:hypothetical protein
MYFITSSTNRMRQAKYQNIKLSFDGRDVCFQSEQDLETYVEQNFNIIFPNLTLLARQYTILERRCDLICYKTANKQAVIIELKNQEDRYVVTQLTRYHKSLLLSKPFADIIDYSLPIDLIAISPKFHPDNYIDREDSKLEFQTHFYEFKIECVNSCYRFKLLDRYFDLNYPILGLINDESIQVVDRDFLLSKPGQFYQRLESDCHQDFLKLHYRFISQSSIKCWNSNNDRCILYGTGTGENHQKLAEINNGGQNLYLYLWLPTAVKTKVKIPIARFGFICRQGNRPISIDAEVEWIVCTKNNISLKDRPQSLSDGFSFNRQGMLKWCPARNYLNQAHTNNNTLDLLVYLLKNIERPFSEEDWSWWENNKHPTPTNLGWYVDLAVKTWQYRRSR